MAVPRSTDKYLPTSRSFCGGQRSLRCDGVQGWLVRPIALAWKAQWKRFLVLTPRRLGDARPARYEHQPPEHRHPSLGRAVALGFSHENTNTGPSYGECTKKHGLDARPAALGRRRKGAAPDCSTRGTHTLVPLGKYGPWQHWLPRGAQVCNPGGALEQAAPGRGSPAGPNGEPTILATSEALAADHALHACLCSPAA
ncbi:hypothetical protein Micbo1qcDRAFT_174151 [Microdochium bolleyi]|uniref:Uncharacterized protein n=1 Tax=Microdochium bolleyi TaxID=196109 RepID=A0A136J7A9_9PEZI|nr:hypothetical protein Micbo1qcDRAFT_174151 [Microdochium bolleyi]